MLEQELESELALVRQLIYKNSKQHRRSRYIKDLREVAINLHNLFKIDVLKYFKVKSQDGDQPSDTSSLEFSISKTENASSIFALKSCPVKQASGLSSQKLIPEQSIDHKILYLNRICQNLSTASLKLTRTLSPFITSNRFVSFALAVIGVAARLNAICRRMQTAVQETLDTHSNQQGDIQACNQNIQSNIIASNVQPCCRVSKMYDSTLDSSSKQVSESSAQKKQLDSKSWTKVQTKRKRTSKNRQI